MIKLNEVKKTCDHFDHTNDLTDIEIKQRFGVLKKQFLYRLKLIKSGKKIEYVKMWCHFESFEVIFFGPKFGENVGTTQKIEQTELILRNSQKIDALRLQIASLERKVVGTEQSTPLLDIPLLDENLMESTDAMAGPSTARSTDDYSFLDQLLTDLN